MELPAHWNVPLSEYASASAATMKRRRQVVLATPPWADLAAIEAVYKKAEARTKREARCRNNPRRVRRYSVDHVIPLQHPLVSGLHVENNLRVVSTYENSKKCNEFAIE